MSFGLQKLHNNGAMCFMANQKQKRIWGANGMDHNYFLEPHNLRSSTDNSSPPKKLHVIVTTNLPSTLPCTFLPKPLPLESFLFGCISLDASQAGLQIRCYSSKKKRIHSFVHVVKAILSKHNPEYSSPILHLRHASMQLFQSCQ